MHLMAEIGGGNKLKQRKGRGGAIEIVNGTATA